MSSGQETAGSRAAILPFCPLPTVFKERVDNEDRPGIARQAEAPMGQQIELDRAGEHRGGDVPQVPDARVASEAPGKKCRETEERGEKEDDSLETAPRLLHEKADRADVATQVEFIP